MPNELLDVQMKKHMFLNFRMFMMVSLPLSQRRRNFLLHILASFTIPIGLNIPQFFAFKTEEVDSHHLYFLTVFFHSISQLYLMCILQLM